MRKLIMLDGRRFTQIWASSFVWILYQTVDESQIEKKKLR